MLNVNDKRVKEILKRYEPIWALDHALGLMGWDLETYMPRSGVEYRGFATSQLMLMRQKLMLELEGLVSSVDEGGLNDYEKGIVRVLKHELKFYTKVPPSLIEELSKTTTKASVVWREAKAKADFNMFKPHLGKIIDLTRQVADKLGYSGHPYNALLDLYEENLTINDLDPLFSRLVGGIRQLLSRIDREIYPTKHELEEAKYNVDEMRIINEEVAFNVLGMPRDRFRIDTSAHPFTIGMAPGDVRITTRYEGVDFKATLFSVIHESGHALYELQIDESLAYTPLARGASTGFHESQSRFLENVIGRGRYFVRLIYPILKSKLSILGKFNENDVYSYFNVVRPSLIRVDADEVTYNLHIAVRYELEKKIIEGSMEVNDLPEAWNTLMENYLGVRPRNDSEGVLQDIHWSQGSIGYFPTYTLGNVIAAIILNRIEKELDLRNLVEHGHLDPIKDWLRDRIHKWGAVYEPKELLRRSLNEGYNPEHLLNYLESKYVKNTY
ncbi:MAG: carboxypeptidase M32 [Caldivirga sp.]|uniref:carboxypeptidase M32 n=1 Tax=Caldivirga sp. TaxID=2080243 RepID=UPI003D134CAD